MLTSSGSNHDSNDKQDYLKVFLFFPVYIIPG